MRREKMGKKLLLSLILLLALSLSTPLNMNPASVSATEYPTVMIVPESIVDPNLTPGTTFTVSIYTDYTGDDVWGWQFTLSFNPLVLHGVDVTELLLLWAWRDTSHNIWTWNPSQRDLHGSWHRRI